MHYTLVYTWIAGTNVTGSTSAAAGAAVPIPPEPLDVTHTTVDSDVTAAVGIQVTRTIVLHNVLGTPLPFSDLPGLFVAYMQGVLELALSTIVISQPVVVTP